MIMSEQQYLVFRSSSRFDCIHYSRLTGKQRYLSLWLEHWFASGFSAQISDLMDLYLEGLNVRAMHQSPSEQ